MSEGTVKDYGETPTVPRLDGEILRVLVGSTAHGISSASEDRDEMGIRISRPQFVSGLSKFDQYEYRTKPDGVRSGPGDLDLTVYDVRKWCWLAVKGNPSILALLYAPEVLHMTYLGLELREDVAELVKSKYQLTQFAGYLRAQISRYRGERGGTHGARVHQEPDRKAKYLWHAYRLGVQGVEYANTGKFSMPMHAGALAVGQAIRSQVLLPEDSLAFVEAVEAELLEAMKHTSLPESANLPAVNEWLHHAHQTYWSTL